MTRGIERAFQAAAIEIEQTPASPAGRALMWMILLFVALATSWAALSRIDVVAVARGHIIASGYSKKVQPLQIGTVTTVHVVEGRQVKAGDVLLQLDNSSVQADIDRLGAERDMAEREITRCRRLVQWLESGAAPSEIESQSDRMLRRQWREYEDRVDVLLHERQKNQAARAGAQTQVDKLNAVLPIVSRKADSQKGLAAKKLLSEQQYLSAEQERREMYHELLAGKGRVEELAAAVATLDARVEHARSEFHSGVLERLDDAERRYSVALQELVKASVRAKANTITSPVDGVVQQLAVHSPGTVVTPAQDLMVIVPEGDALEVEALLENKDIGFVEPGQQAEIKVDAFPFTRYGTIDGKVENLSRDAVADERKGLVYKMRVQMSQSSIRVNERQVALSPGMTVTVESKTGTRRLIEFFLSPLLRYRDEGLRER